MALSLNEINTLRTKLRIAAPHLAADIDRLAEQAAPRRRVQWVEVTHSDGTSEILAADEYQRLTATDLAHRQLRMLTEAEARARRGLG
jgi:hypothetical protein